MLRNIIKEQHYEMSGKIALLKNYVYLS